MAVSVTRSTMGICGDEFSARAGKAARETGNLGGSAEHEAAVAAFLRDAAERDPETFVEVCETHPVTTRYGFRAIFEREVSLEAMVARYGENGFTGADGGE